MKDSITYTGNGQVNVKLGGMSDSPSVRILPGNTVKRGDIPDDAFSCLADRPDFGGDIGKYLARKGQRVAPPEPKPEGKSKSKKPAKAKPETAKE